MHARNKPLDRSDDDALLRRVADLTIGYSGAELANLMNESAILAVSSLFRGVVEVMASAVGNSGAELANLMNESAILAAGFLPGCFTCCVWYV